MGGRQVLAARRMLADALEGGPEGDADEEERAAAARRVVATLGAPDRLADLVAELASGEGGPEGCARLSYRHVLGFDKLLLVDAAPRHMLRAHLWHPRTSAGPGADDIHNHRSTVASYTVRGRMAMELYEERDDGTIRAERYQESLTQDAAADWLLAPAGPARLRLTHTAQYAAGSAYALPPHTLHRAWCDTDALTVTVFLETGRGRRAHTDVFAAAGPRPEAVPKVPLRVPDYLAALGRLAELLRTS